MGCGGQSQSVLQAFLAGLFTWGCTIVGSAIVFFFKHNGRKLLDIMMGFGRCDDFCSGRRVDPRFEPMATRMLRPWNLMVGLSYDDPRSWDKELKAIRTSFFLIAVIFFEKKMVRHISKNLHLVRSIILWPKSNLKSKG